MAVLKIGILISGRGSNMKALVEAARATEYPARAACVISNEPSAQGLEFARAEKIPAYVIDHRAHKNRQAFEEALDKQLNAHGVQLVCLAGFMRILTPWFVERWRDRLINIHPSLLPAFPGLDTHKKALEAGVKFAGCTVHFVRAEMDHGPIIIQAAVPVLDGDNEEKLAERVLEAEYKIYPETVRLIGENRVNIHKEQVFITNSVAPSASFFNPVPGQCFT